MLRAQRQTIATTHVDRHGERLTRAALDSIIDQLRAHYIPVGYEHDPRFPPVGRMIDAEVVELPDGVQAVEASIQFWDADPTEMSIKSDDRDIPRLADTARPGVMYDRSFMDAASAGLVAEIGAILESKPVTVSKKDFEPIPVLTLVLGSFALGGIAQGFFSKLGEDLYSGLKSCLSKLFERRRDPRLLQIVLSAASGKNEIEVVVVIESPGKSTFDGLLDHLLPSLDQVLPRMLSTLDAVLSPRRIVLVWRKGALVPLHVLDTHGVPVAVFEIPPLKSKRKSRPKGKPSALGEKTPAFAIDDASSTWRSFDLVRVEEGASLNLPNLGTDPTTSLAVSENRKRPPHKEDA